MLRIALGVIAGFVGWLILWVGVEKILSAVMPDWYGAPQNAFQSAIENGGDFRAETRLLLSHLVIASIVSVASGYLAALAADDSSRAPLIAGSLIVAMALLKAYMSWPYVPLWYHVIFTAILLPMVIFGGKLYAAN